MNKFFLFLITGSLFFPGLLYAVTPVTTNNNQNVETTKNTITVKNTDNSVSNQANQKTAASETLSPSRSEATNAETQNTQGVVFSGYIDGSYNYLLRKNIFTSDALDRINDLAENGFRLQEIGLTLANQPKQGFGYLANLLIGQDALVYDPYGFQPKTGIYSIGYALVQCYMQYAVNNLTVTAGQQLSLTGYEQLDPTLNTNFSAGIIGYAIPGTIMGVRASYQATKDLTLITGVYNGWDNVRDTSRHKTIELGVTYAFNPILTISVQGYSGAQRIEDMTSVGQIGRRSIIELISTVKATDKLSFATEIDYAMQNSALLPNDVVGKAVWGGIAQYMSYQISDKWIIAFRAEDFNDHDGYRTGVAQNWKEVTVTLGYSPVKSMMIHLETRRDFS